MYLSSVDSFLLGYKPSCYESINTLSAEKKDKLFTFPNHQVSTEFRLFFQTSKQKTTFLSFTKGMDHDNPTYIKALGDILGYPPKATSYFANYHKIRHTNLQQATKYFQNTRVNMLYCGLQFMSHVDDLVENTHWLWDTYRYAGPLRFKLFPPEADPIQLVIPFRDQLQLRDSIANCSEWLQSQTYINQVIISK